MNDARFKVTFRAPGAAWDLVPSALAWSDGGGGVKLEDDRRDRGRSHGASGTLNRYFIGPFDDGSGLVRLPSWRDNSTRYCSPALALFDGVRISHPNVLMS